MQSQINAMPGSRKFDIKSCPMIFFVVLTLMPQLFIQATALEDYREFPTQV